MFYFQLSIILICLFLRSTEHDHVKDNLPAKLLRIRTFGKMKLEEFKDLISAPDYKTCETKMEKNPTWYPLTLDVFVKFLYKVISFLSTLHSPSFSSILMPYHCTHPSIPQRKISSAANAAARLFNETTPEDRRSALDIWDTMTKTQDRLIKSIWTRTIKKYISVAHNDNDKDFFNEVFLRLFLNFYGVSLVFIYLVIVYIFLHASILLHKLIVHFLPFLCRT